jgi:hypothetical protein
MTQLCPLSGHPSSPGSPAAYTYDAKGRVISMTSGTGSALNCGFEASSNLTTLPVGAAGTYEMTTIDPIDIIGILFIDYLRC